jgi:hypothetical protein
MTEQNNVGSIFGKIATIQREVGAIPRAGVGPSAKGSFKYVKAEDILDKIHSLLVQENVIVVPALEYTKHETEYVNNRQMVSVAIKAQYQYVSVEDGSYIIVTSIGEGSDIGSDTATRKAATQALKISHLHTFTIPNSEFDDEGYESSAGRSSEPANTKAAQVISKASRSAVTPEVSELQGTVRKFVDGGVGADIVKAIGERVTKELKKPSYDKNDADILRGIVTALNAGEVA